MQSGSAAIDSVFEGLAQGPAGEHQDELFKLVDLNRSMDEILFTLEPHSQILFLAAFGLESHWHKQL